MPPIQRSVAAENGVQLQWLDRDAAHAKEPEIVCEAALFSPMTGIVDSHSYMLALLADAERHGANIVYRSRVAAMWRTERDEGTATLVVLALVVIAFAVLAVLARGAAGN